MDAQNQGMAGNTGSAQKVPGGGDGRNTPTLNGGVEMNVGTDGNNVGNGLQTGITNGQASQVQNPEID